MFLLPVVSLLSASLMCSTCSEANAAESTPTDEQAYSSLVSSRPKTALEYFSQTFSEADAKFVKACQVARGELEYFDHPLLGEAGEPLRALVCHQYKTGDEPNVLLSLSGVHGVEGFAGAAMQVGVLNNPELRHLPSDWRAVHVHMVNPYGAAWNLKENEDNIDIEKNLAEMHLQNIENPILVNFIDGLNIPNFDQPDVQQAGFALLFEYAMTYGNAFFEALRIGQGERLVGLGYFGQSEAWSSNLVNVVVDHYLQNTQKVFLFDFHTAYGEYGKWSALGLEEESHQALDGWLQGVDVNVEPSDFFSGEDDFFEFIKDKTNAELRRAFFELGTYPESEYQVYFVLSLHCHYYAADLYSGLCQFTNQQLREYFYPADDAWKESAWNDFVPMYQAIKKGLKKW